MRLLIQKKTQPKAPPAGASRAGLGSWGKTKFPSISPAASESSAARQALPGHGPNQGANPRGMASGRQPDFSRVPAHRCLLAAQAAPSASIQVNSPGDRYEQEADRIASRVMRIGVLSPESGLNPAPGPSSANENPASGLNPENGWLSRAAPVPGTRSSWGEPGVAQRAPAQGPARAAAAAPTAAPDLGIPSTGQALDAAARAFFEPRFGHDFQGVRVHSDCSAAEWSSRLSARAFTYGNDIYFNHGQYHPGSGEGRELLAHELAHVVQQTNGLKPLIQRTLEGCRSLLSEPSAISLISGNAVHSAIQSHFNGSVVGATSVMIPGGSAGPLRSQGICGEDSSVILPQIIGGAAGAGFPDLARHTPLGALQVAEIKPAAFPCLIDGEQQLLRYVDQGNATDPPQVAWRAANAISTVVPMPESAYTPPSFAVPGGEIRTAWCTPGLLAYSVRARGVPIPVPVPVGSRERVDERRRYHDTAGDRIGEVGAVVVGATATVVAGRALWRHFWRVVARRFAVRGAVAAALAAADGPLPFGEIVDIGLGVATAIEIFIIWDDLWREADQLAAQEA